MVSFIQTLTNGAGMFQHDISAYHNSKKVKNFLKNKKLEILPWPANYPEVIPTDNLLSI